MLVDFALSAVLNTSGRTSSRQQLVAVSGIKSHVDVHCPAAPQYRKTTPQPSHTQICKVAIRNAILEEGGSGSIQCERNGIDLDRPHLAQRPRTEGDSALGDTVRLVRDRLLQISLPVDSDEEWKLGYRTNAKGLRKQLDEIVQRGELKEEYFSNGRDRSNITSPKQTQFAEPSLQSTGSGSLLSPTDAARRHKRAMPGRATTIASLREYTSNVKSDWSTLDDSEFALSIIPNRTITSETDLCTSCKESDPLSPRIEFDRKVLDALDHDSDCALCSMVSDMLIELDYDQNTIIVLDKSEGNFVLPDTSRKVLRLCRTATDRDCWTVILNNAYQFNRCARSYSGAENRFTDFSGP
ncbi:hypothetical protein EK21DRAFT_94896 [Setomelanomma holmii]|uniref:Uncharacterized protein n=1 Tax=Setomelanomma holmii TaxID=210430 RepID=A0A9P4GXU3_9PLEO|nr:hypothetical protein EK21DRAFT_94896 [Setomelanomma holmii]